MQIVVTKRLTSVDFLKKSIKSLIVAETKLSPKRFEKSAGRIHAEEILAEGFGPWKFFHAGKNTRQAILF